jgi:hypothetical protein
VNAPSEAVQLIVGGELAGMVVKEFLTEDSRSHSGIMQLSQHRGIIRG